MLLLEQVVLLAVVWLVLPVVVVAEFAFVARFIVQFHEDCRVAVGR